MPPKKKVERGAQENISLGPQVREGNAGLEQAIEKDNIVLTALFYLQVNSFSASPESLPPSTTPSCMSPIFRTSDSPGLLFPHQTTPYKRKRTLKWNALSWPFLWQGG